VSSIVRGSLVLAATVTALSLAPAAFALTKPQADAAALKALRPQATPGSVVVFGLPRALGPKDWLTESAPAAHPKQAKSTLRPKLLGHKAWLYWDDLAYGSYFAHKSIVLLVDDKTGAVVRRAYNWWPLVDGKAPAFATSGYIPQTGAIFSSAKRAAALAWTPHATFDPPLQVPPGAFDGDCILLVGTPGELIFVNDLNAVAAEGKHLGIPTFAASHSGSVNDPPNGTDVGNAVTRLAKDEHCKDILIYFHAHSYAPGGPTAMHVGTVTKTVHGSVMQEQRDITPDELKKMMTKNASVTFKLFFDTCFAQHFTDALGGQPNVLIGLASSSGTEESWWFHAQSTSGGNPVTNTTNNPGVTNFRKGRSEFLNGMLSGIENVVTDETQVQEAQGEGGSFLANVLRQAFAQEGANDFASQTGHTHPAMTFNPLVPPAPPSVTPIGAVFIQADFATYYGVTATDPAGRKLTYAWSLKPPDKDPNCKMFSTPAAEPWRSVWYHGDQHGCNHLVTDPGGAGHPGTVTLVVSNGLFNCTLTYFGTETGTGPPPTCVAKP
jgi:hypothetical protein